MEPSLYRVGIYLRVSTQEQSVELQKRELLAYSTARGWAGVTFYEDVATGTSSNRVALKQLMTDARERRLDLILTWKLDRFFRSLKDLVVTLQELTELGVMFTSLKDNIDLTTSSGRLLVHLLGAFAEFEAALIKERVKSGLRNAKAKGKRLGRPLKRNDEWIEALRDKGLTVRQIAQEVGVSKSTVATVLSKNGCRSGEVIHAGK